MVRTAKSSRAQGSARGRCLQPHPTGFHTPLPSTHTWQNRMMNLTWLCEYCPAVSHLANTYSPLLVVIHSSFYPVRGVGGLCSVIPQVRESSTPISSSKAGYRRDASLRQMYQSLQRLLRQRRPSTDHPARHQRHQFRKHRSCH